MSSAALNSGAYRVRRGGILRLTMFSARRGVSGSLGISLVISLGVHAAAFLALVQLFYIQPSGSSGELGSGGERGPGGEFGSGGERGPGGESGGAGLVFVELIGRDNAPDDPISDESAFALASAKTSSVRPEPKRVPPQHAQQSVPVTARRLALSAEDPPEPISASPQPHAAEAPTKTTEPMTRPAVAIADTSSAGASGPSQTGGDGGSRSAPGSATASGAAFSNAPLSGVARPASEIRPHYPDAARERGDEAEVIVEAWVAASGQVERARVHTSAGREFDEAALEAVQEARFYPASRDGKPVASAVAMRLHFELGN